MKAIIEKQHIKVPIEIFLDVCKIIHLGDLNNKINGCNDSSGEVLLTLTYAKENKIQVSAMQNIYNVVNEWNEIRYGEDCPDEITLN